MAKLEKTYPGIIVRQHHTDRKTNGIAERAVRRINEGTSAVLMQSGLEEKWSADSMKCYCYLRDVWDLLADGKTPRYREVSGELVSTQYWNLFLIPPHLCKKLSHVRTDQCEEDKILDRNIDARSSNFAAPSSSRFAESSCRSNLIINFDTSRQFWSNVTVSASIHFRSVYGLDTEDNVEFDVCCGLAFATGFPVLLSLSNTLNASLFRHLRYVLVDSVHDPEPRACLVAK